MEEIIKEHSEQDVLDAVRKDDAKAFSALIAKKRGYLSLCFGRFPVLSLCYIYKSKKIIGEFGTELAAVAYYQPAEEPVDAYQIFKDRAGTNLRTYGQGSVVSPPEMLAILGETDYLKQKYAGFRKNEQIESNIAKIYAGRGKEVKTTGQSIWVSGEGMKKPEKLVLSVCAALASLFLIVFIICLSYVNSNIGYGTQRRPYRVYSAAQLNAAANNDAHYLLCSDITFPKDFFMKEFSAKLDGGGHTITIETSETEISEDYGFITTKNSGTISNLVVSLNVKVKGHPGEGDIVLGVIAAINTGVISNCTVKGSVEADTVDLGGMAGINEAGGSISRCENEADFSQTTGHEKWSPGTAGIAFVNLGEISDCKNSGKISSFQKAESEDSDRGVYAAGIVSHNEGLIESCANSGSIYGYSAVRSIVVSGISAINFGGEISGCENTGNISAKTDAEDGTGIEIRVSGIASVNIDTVNASGRLVVKAKIKNCKAYGLLNADAAEIVILIGGIAAWCPSGEITGNYSAVETANVPGNGVVIGSLVSCSYADAYFYGSNLQVIELLFKTEKNVYAEKENIAYGLGGCIADIYTIYGPYATYYSTEFWLWNDNLPSVAGMEKESAGGGGNIT